MGSKSAFPRCGILYRIDTPLFLLSLSLGPDDDNDGDGDDASCDCPTTRGFWKLTSAFKLMDSPPLVFVVRARTRTAVADKRPGHPARRLISVAVGANRPRCGVGFASRMGVGFRRMPCCRCCLGLGLRRLLSALARNRHTFATQSAAGEYPSHHMYASGYAACSALDRAQQESAKWVGRHHHHHHRRQPHQPRL